MSFPYPTDLTLYSGQWYCLPYGRGSGTLAVTALRCYFYPVWVPARTRFAAIGFATSAGAALSNGRVGLYSIRDGKPHLKIFESASQATTGIGAISVTLTGPNGDTGLTLDAGWYFVAFCSDGTPTIRVVVGDVKVSFGIAALTTTTNVSNYIYTSLGSLSLPADASGSSFTFVTGNPPGVLLQPA